MAAYFEPGRGWRYDFERYGKRYRAPRGFRTKDLCNKAEQAMRERIEKRAAGLPDDIGTAPTFSAWAGTTYDYRCKRAIAARRPPPVTLERTLRKVLQFWGMPPTDPSKAVNGAPYHDLTLDAPIRDARWLLTFEQWMEKHQLAGSTRNHYRSACSMCYRVAMAPEYRAETGVIVNPFIGIPRDACLRRESVFTRPQLRTIIQAAVPPVRMAIGIALLAPELRLGNIANLTWDQVDGDWFRIAQHKTAGHTGRPLVTPIVPALKVALDKARATSSNGFVIPDIGVDRVRRIQNGFQMAVTAAGLTYGTGEGHYSFHTLRHTAVTTMAELGISDVQRRDAVGHLALQTTQRYTHLSPHHKVAPLMELSKALAPTLRTSVPKARRRSA